MKLFKRQLIAFSVATSLSFSVIAMTFEEDEFMAMQGDVIAQVNLANDYYNGEIVEKDYAKAVVWYTKAANQGNDIAQFNLATMYDRGQGVRQNYSKAMEWYTKAANQGKATAQYNLAIMYEEGQGVRQDSAIAKEWFGKACDNGFQKGCDRYKTLNLRR